MHTDADQRTQSLVVSPELVAIDQPSDYFMADDMYLRHKSSFSIHQLCVVMDSTTFGYDWHQTAAS
jgi:hypothetical protein